MFSWLGQGNRRPTAATVMERAIILQQLLAKGMSLPPPDQIGSIMAKWTDQERSGFEQRCRLLYKGQVEKLESIGLWKKMESEEPAFLEAGPLELSPQAQIDAMWLAESIGCLLWALNRMGELPAYDQEMGLNSIKASPDESVRDLLSAAQLRSQREIDKQRDVAEFWHWRCRTRQLIESGQMPERLKNGMTINEVISMAAKKGGDERDFVPIDGDFPAFGKPFRDLSDEEFLRIRSISQERHKALNWLCGYAPRNCWSDTPTNT